MPDYGYGNEAMGFLGGALEKFASTYADFEDRKLKKMQMEAKAKADQEEKKRKQFEDALKIRTSGFSIPEGFSGEAYELDPSQLKYDPEYMKMKLASQDPYGLRPLQAEKTALDVQKARREASIESQGKQLPPDKVLLVQQGAQIPTMLDDIKVAIDKNKDIMGPVQGRAGQANTYNEQAQSADAQFRAVSQAFGRYMEGGVLRKEDEEKYRKMFPQLSDTPQVAKNKLGIVRKILADKHNSDIKARGAQGYSTSGFGLLKSGLVKDERKVAVSNGKETFMIDPNDLSSAKKDGFKPVKDITGSF